MKKLLLGIAVGSISTYTGLSYFNPSTSTTLSIKELQTVNSYINHHKLQKMLKQSIMNGYSQLNKAFLDYGMKLKLDGFYYYGTFFQKEQMDKNHITKSSCIFSPKEQLCGHPDIQHGGATATIADQNSGMLAMLFSKELVATAQLDVKYKKPVKRGQIYVWQGQIENRDQRKIYVKSIIKELQTGSVCAQIKVLMMTVNWQHRMGDVFHLLFNSNSISQTK